MSYIYTQNINMSYIYTKYKYVIYIHYSYIYIYIYIQNINMSYILLNICINICRNICHIYLYLNICHISRSKKCARPYVSWLGYYLIRVRNRNETLLVNPFIPTVPTFAVPLNPSKSIVLSEHYRL